MARRRSGASKDNFSSARSAKWRAAIAIGEGNPSSGCIALAIWHGEKRNVAAAQQALRHRARCDQAARRGDYTDAMEGHQT